MSFSFSHSTIDEIGKYYEDCESGLEAFYLKLCPEDRFIGYSKSELEKELKEKKPSLIVLAPLSYWQLWKPGSESII